MATPRRSARLGGDEAGPSSSQGGEQAPTSTSANDDEWYYELDPGATHVVYDDDDEDDGDDRSASASFRAAFGLDDDMNQDDDDDDDFDPGDDDDEVDEERMASLLFAPSSSIAVPNPFQDDGEGERLTITGAARAAPGLGDSEHWLTGQAEDDDDDLGDDDGAIPSLRFGNIEFRLTLEDENGQPTAGTAQTARPIARLLRAAGAGQWSPRDLMLFLQHPDMEFILNRVNEPDGEEFITNEFNRIMRGSSRPKDPNRFPKVPSVEGRRLMASGQFGANNYERFPNKSLPMRLLERELGAGSQRENDMNNHLIKQCLIPGTPADQILHFEDPVYSGQFSDDGRFFYSCSQDFKIRLYDTTNPYNWKLYKTVHYPWGQWTLTDASLSPDNKWIAYSSHSSLVSIAPTDPSDQGDPYSLDLSDGPGVRGFVAGRLYGFSSIFSVRFSGNGRELVAGTNGNSVIVYDIESRSVLHSICGHNEDVNAVCFADKYSPHIIYSGSDDSTVKVWDRRSMGDQREVAAFVGHIAGVTYIDSKGDGRYVLSNGKDQSMKLWDIRKAYSSTEWRGLQPFRRRHFDYRMGRYNEDNWDPHPDDNSVVTFRGHQVLQTLIRCHFSPPNSSDSRYVYSGSKDGKVHIWNLDATKAAEIDVKEATRGTRPRDGRTRHYFSDARGDWATCVRDASWHPHAPFIAASALNGFSMSHGTVSLHSYGVADDGDSDDGSPPVPLLMNESLEPTPWENKGVGGYKASDYEGNDDDEEEEDFEEDEEVSE